MGNNLSIHAKPILKWAGGKSQMLKYILPLIPNYSGRYIEPFLGGGAVYFALNPDNAIISDSNPELINMYRQVADNVESVITYLNKYKNDKELFYAVREQVWENLPKAEAAARMIFLNKTCFNGLYRVNKKGMFNTPFGNYKNPVICDEDRLRNASKILSKATLVCGDYLDVLKSYAKSGDFVFLDPPYVPVGKYGDLYCVFDNYVILTEVTMSTSSRQEAMEGEPVRRHVSDAVINYTKPVYCMFIANKVNMNTAETFRHGVWYTNLIKKQRLNIVPLTLKQFKDYFDYLFNSNQAEPDRIVDLLDTCICKRDAMEAPIWMDYIDKLISEKELINQKSCKFPFGVYFGSHIFDNVDKATGIVVGMNDDYILVAYENTFEPKIITYDRLAFENNVCKIA